MVDGFLFKVFKDEEKGWIKAPFGIYVALSDEKGLRQFTCDSASCAALPWFVAVEKDRYMLLADPMPVAVPSGVSVALGGTSGQMLPAAPINFINPSFQYKSAQPSCLPINSELVVVNFAYQRGTTHFVAATQLTHCYNHGKNDGVGALPSISRTYTISGVLTAGADAYRIIPLLVAPGYHEFAEWKPHYLHRSTTAPGHYQVLLYAYSYVPGGVIGSSERRVSHLYTGMSADFSAKILSTGVSVRQLAAHYSRTADDVKGVCALYTTLDPTCDNLGAHAGHYTSATSSGVAPADRKWSHTLSFISIAGTNTTSTFEDMKDKIYELAGNELKYVVDALGLSFSPPFDWTNYAATDPQRVLARYILGALFGWPADSEHTYAFVRDTVTFADSEGVVYSWLRAGDAGATQHAITAPYAGTRNGGFKFEYPYGWSRVSLIMPSAVLTDNTQRPKIHLITSTTYCCIADKADGTVAGLYIGSPFTSWNELTLPVGVTMFCIRVVVPEDTTDKVSFIGIGKAGTIYSIYFKPPGAGWVKLSPIPVEGDVVDLAASWDVCVFGDDAIVKKMMDAKQHPVASYARQPDLR
jgi:hypothetical protein